jgi:RimJ/RimL family protein N-acetyltransferase
MTSAPPESIELAVGVLGRIREVDAEPVAQAIAASFDHLRPWMPWATEYARHLDAQRTFCRESETQWDEGSDYIWLLRPHGDDAVAGSFGLHRRVGPGAIEVGYWVHADYVRRGYATAGAYALTAAALQLADVEQVLIRTDENNVASAAIPLRLGYRLDHVEGRSPEAPAESGRLQVWTWPAVAGRG